MADPRTSSADEAFILAYDASELRIAADFLTTWLPFLSRDLCPGCSRNLAHRVSSLVPGTSSGTSLAPEPLANDACMEHIQDSAHESPETPRSVDNCDTYSPGSWKGRSNDNCDTNSLGSWKDCSTEWTEPVEAVTPADMTVDMPSVRISWADMAQEDELEEQRGGSDVQEYKEINNSDAKKKQKPTLSREEREYIRFMNVQRKNDFICLERVKGKFVNILEGLELHTGVFSAAEQKRIVDYVYALQEMGKKGELKERTYAEPPKWMRGKGRATIQFGCCYNYAVDKKGNPPGILRNELVDPLPHLLKVMIKRLIGWHVIPPACVPNSCIVNIYEPGDCIPPHIDNHDFVRPFCTVSFLSECDILFGSNLRIAGPGEFTGSYAILLPVGSVLVLNGNGADVAKHCVPAVPAKRISITFRKMDESKQPFGFVPEPDLQGIQPTNFDIEKPNRWRSSMPQGTNNGRASAEGSSDHKRGSNNWGFRSERSRSGRNRSQPSNFQH